MPCFPNNDECFALFSQRGRVVHPRHTATQFSRTFSQDLQTKMKPTVRVRVCPSPVNALQNSVIIRKIKPNSLQTLPNTNMKSKTVIQCLFMSQRKKVVQCRMQKQITQRVFSLLRLTDQPLENGAVRLAESARGVKLHHFPSMQHQHPVAVHDGVDPGDAQMQTNLRKQWTRWRRSSSWCYWLL